MITKQTAIAKIGWPKYHAMGMANVRWDADYTLWTSQTSNKLFSYEWVNDHGVDEIETAAREHLDEGQFRIWFNVVPAPDDLVKLEEV